MKPMKLILKLLCLAAPTLACSSALAADDEVEMAVKRLAESGSYEWKSDLHLPGGQKQAVSIEGRYNFSQGVHLKLQLGEKALEVASRDGVVVASTGEEWKPAKKFTRSDTIQSALRSLIEFTLPHHQLESIVDKWRNVKKQDDGSYQGTADVTSAKKMLTSMLKQGGQIGNANSAESASLKATLWLEGGLPVKSLLEFQGSGGGGIRAGQDMKASVLTTFSNIGNTTVKLPPEAEAAILAAKKP
jgi:hypothetical protein